MYLLLYYCLIGIIFASIINVKELIVDEVFHVGQVQSFCFDGILNSKYDQKITTPPGPYIFSWIIHHILKIMGYDWNCSLVFLRCTNVIYGCALPLVLKGLMSSDLGSAVELSLFPPLFFFHFIYYTDSGSVFWVLSAYLASRKEWYKTAAIFSFFSITYRQTNIIWMLLIMGLSILDFMKKSNQNPNFIEFFQYILDNYRFIVKKLWGFGMVGLIFGGFLYCNNGIVIGDKSNHMVAFHFPQVYYFSVFLVFFSWDYDLILRAFYILKRPLSTFFIASIMGWTILNFTIEHPFLLSDNRHFSFYIWRWFFKGRVINRLLAIPLYILALAGIFSQMVAVMGEISITGYLLAVLLTLVPSPLLEFRYYILPFYFYKILTYTKDKNLNRKIVMDVLINAIVFWIFLFKTFEIKSDKAATTQRFMW